jgi:hypothetical protein
MWLNIVGRRLYREIYIILNEAFFPQAIPSQEHLTTYSTLNKHQPIDISSSRLVPGKKAGADGM